jgi:hypothetical protein
MCIFDRRRERRRRLIVVGSNELLRRAHSGAHRERTGDVGEGNGNVHAREIVVAGIGRLLLERVQVLVFAFEILFVVTAERLAVLTRFMSTAMPAKHVRDYL